jgi:hypothetical protein
VFEEDRLVCERVYYDLLTVLKGLGVARDPDSPLGQVMTLVNHPVHLARAFGRDLAAATARVTARWMIHRSRSRCATTARTR